MKAEDLIRVLNEYPPSSRLVVKNRGMPGFETTVAETICNLLAVPRGSAVAYFDSVSFIIREKLVQDPFQDPITRMNATATQMRGMYVEIDAYG